MAVSKIKFDPFQSICFAGRNTVVALHNDNVRVARTATGTFLDRIEVQKGSSAIYGVEKSVYVGHRMEGINQVDLETAKTLPIYTVNKNDKEEMTAFSMNPFTEMIFTATRNNDKTSTIRIVDLRDVHNSCFKMRKPAVSRLVCIGEGDVLVEQTNGAMHLFDGRNTSQPVWGFDTKGNCKSVVEVGRFICVDLQDEVKVLESGSGRVKTRFSMLKDHQFAGAIDGNFREDFFILSNSLKSTKMNIYGLLDYSSGKKNALFSYLAHAGTTSNFIKFKKQVYATGDVDGNVLFQFADTGVECFKKSVDNLRKEFNAVKEDEKKDEKNNQLLRRVRKDKNRDELRIVEERQKKREKEGESVGADSVGSRTDDYEFGKEIGEGGFGKVKIVTSRKDGKQYACKIVLKSNRFSEQYLQNRESRNHSQINNIHIIRLLDFFEEDRSMFQVMELMEKSLANMIEENGKIDESETAVIVEQFGLGLKYCHHKGLIHRDVKPDNVLVGFDGRVKLGDFGLSTFEEGRTLCGTPGYIAPEVFLERKYNEKVDCWSTGCVLVEMLTGTPAFHANNPNGSKNRWELDDSVEFVSEAYTVVKALLNKDPKERLSIKALLDSDWIFKQKEAFERKAVEDVRRRM